MLTNAGNAVFYRQERGFHFTAVFCRRLLSMFRLRSLCSTTVILRIKELQASDTLRRVLLLFLRVLIDSLLRIHSSRSLYTTHYRIF